jgi:3-oxoacyl-[acyl-carrier protein] reductase
MRVSVDAIGVTFDVTQGKLGNVPGNVITKRLKDAAVKVLRHTQLPFDSFLMQVAGLALPSPCVDLLRRGFGRQPPGEGRDSTGREGTMSGQGKLSGQTAIVTGAATGLGEAIAKTLAREGASVAVADINLSEAQRVESEILADDGAGLAILCDVTQSRQVTGMVQQVLDRWGSIDILVNNAGGFNKFSPLFKIAEEEWDRVVAFNLKSVFLCCQAVAKHMMERQGGRIVNIASRAGLAPNPGGPDYLPYGAAKAGVMGFTRLLARELGPYGITVNSISPSTVLTQRIIKLRDPESLRRIAEMAPLQHLVEPQDIAESVLFLVSEGARSITGINLNVNSGNLMI